MFFKPVIVGSIAKVFGYLNAAIKKEDYLFDDKMRIYLRKKHRNLFLNRIGINKS